MSKWLKIFLPLLLCLGILPVTADASVGTVKIYVNGTLSTSTVSLKLVHNRIWIPVRSLSETLDQQVEWNQAAKTLVTTKSGGKVELRLSKGITYLNGSPVKLDLSIQNWRGRIYIPIRLLPDLFDVSMTWNQVSRTLYILTESSNSSQPSLSPELRDKLVVLGLPEGDIHCRLFVIKSRGPQ